MREAVLVVCVVSAAKCLIGQMAGGTKMKGQLRFMLDMLLAIVLVTPFAEGIVHFELPEVSSYELTDDYAADLRNRALAEEAAENISGVLMQQITAAGIGCEKVSAEVNISEDGSISISKVWVTAEDIGAAAEIIRNSLGEETEVVNESSENTGEAAGE